MHAPATIPLSVPCLRGNERAYVLDCLETGWISSVGSYVSAFEAAFAGYTGAAAAVAVSSGTAALHLALELADVRGADVLVPALTFIAPVNAVTYAGGHPVFIDCEADSLGLCPQAAAAFLAAHARRHGERWVNRLTGRRLAAIVPVHLFGHSCAIDELGALAADHGLALIEDGAEAVGCRRQGRHVGTFGRCGCFSFNGNKTLSTGGGGMLIAGDMELVRRARHLSTQAKTDARRYRHDAVGYNYRMTNVLAAIGLAQLERVEAMIERKRQVHAAYAAAWADLPLRLVAEQAGERSSFWLAVVELAGDRRDALAARLEARGIESRPLWELNHRQPMYAACPRGPLAVAEGLHRRCLCLPCHPAMTDSDTERVIATVREALA